VAYISDYVTKPGLKTYAIFDAIRQVFNRNSEMLGGNLKRKEKSRKILTQTVNSLTAKIEVGGPMAALYLLGNPDHYTSHKFVPAYWKSYVRETLKPWRSEEDLENILPEKVVVQKQSGGYITASLPLTTTFLFGRGWESHFHCLVVTCGDHCTSSSPLVSYQTSPRHSLHLSVCSGRGIRGLVFSAPSNDEPHGDSKGAPIHASTLAVAALAHRWGVR
jgi:hypothetical protein